MRRGVAILLFALGAHAQESCTTSCHGEEATAFKGCVHEEYMSCTECHGGDPEAFRDKDKAHSPEKGFVGRFGRDKIPGLCGECHSDPIRMHPHGVPTDQLEHYRGSAHGKAVFRGDLDAAVCTDCHGTHRILPATDPRAPTARINQPDTCGRCHSDKALMDKHELPSDSVARFRSSVHGHALLVDDLRGAPACADCHGSHGADPPGARDTDQVCGRCHLNTFEHYKRSPHFGLEGMACDTCHGAHAIETATARMYDKCDECHKDEVRPREVAATIREGTERLRDALGESLGEIARAKRHGVFLDDERLTLRDSERALVSVRPLAHSMDAAAIREHLEQGLRRQERTREEIEKKKTVLRDRKILTTGLAAILLLLAGLLAAKLRAIRELS